MLPIPGRDTQYNLACFQNQERIPLALQGVGERLFVQQAIEVVGGSLPDRVVRLSIPVR